MKQQINLQDNVLNLLRKKKITVKIYLVNGYQLNGFVIGFDNFTIILKKEGQEQLVYKHAVSTIVPQESIAHLLKENDV